jgi:hypothetical protein
MQARYARLYADVSMAATVTGGFGVVGLPRANVEGQGYGGASPRRISRVLGGRRRLHGLRGWHRSGRLGGDLRERLRVVHGEFGEALAVKRDVGGLQAVDQAPVAQAVQTRGRVDAHDPQLTEVALLAAAGTPHPGPAVIVVPDAGPLIYLAGAGHLSLLVRLFDRVVVLASVYDEVVIAGAGLMGARPG